MIPRSHLTLALGTTLTSMALVATADSSRQSSPHLDVDPDGATTIVSIECDPVPVGLLAGVARNGVAGGTSSEFLLLDGDPEGDMPRAVAVTPDGQYAVVVNRDTDLMVFIDLATVEIVGTVTTGSYPVNVAVSGDGRYAISTNVFSNSVTVVDVDTFTVAAEIPITGEQPFRVHCSDDGAIAVVGVINDGVASSFSIIDLDALTESLSFPSTPQGVFGGFFTPAFAIGGNLYTQFAITSDGATIALPWRGGDTVTLYDTATGAATPIAVGPTPSAVDISADDSMAVIVHSGQFSSVTTIDLAAGVASANFPVATPLDAQIARLTPDAEFVMAAISNNVIFVSLATGATTATINTGVVGAIEISADGQLAFVSNFNARVIDIASQTLVATITFGACVDAATSPVENVAVALNNRFREEVYVYEIDVPGASFRGFTRSGPDPEADAPKEIALSPDGTIALVSNAVSRNVSFVDLQTRTVLGVVDTGDVPRESAFTPDGAFALVLNGDSNTTSIIEVATLEVVATLSTPTRPTRIRISPDGSEAYICTIAGTDMLYFVDLDGANSAVTESFPIGQMGAAGGYPYSEVSGMELSPDGRFLALTISFDDILRIVDTRTRQIVEDVPVGDFPIRALFAPSGEEIYVANAFGDSITVVRDIGGIWFPIMEIGGIDFPLDMALDADGTHLYVGECGFQTRSVRVIDLDAGTIVQTIPLTGTPREGAYIASRDEYIVTTDDGFLMVIDAAGPASSIIEQIPISGSAPDMQYSAALDLAVASFPAVPDGIDIIDFGGGALLGDLNGDGVVDGADLGILLNNWGGRGLGDLNGDGTIDGADLGILLNNWS